MFLIVIHNIYTNIYVSNHLLVTCINNIAHNCFLIFISSLCSFLAAFSQLEGIIKKKRHCFLITHPIPYSILSYYHTIVAEIWRWHLFMKFLKTYLVAMELCPNFGPFGSGNFRIQWPNQCWWDKFQNMMW